jgi:hypothetical protein
MVDHYGTARLCFSQGFRGERLRRYGDLRIFWHEADIREKMRTCNQFADRRGESNSSGAAGDHCHGVRRKRPMSYAQ